MSQKQSRLHVTGPKTCSLGERESRCAETLGELCLCCSNEEAARVSSTVAIAVSEPELVRSRWCQNTFTPPTLAWGQARFTLGRTLSSMARNPLHSTSYHRIPTKRTPLAPPRSHIPPPPLRLGAQRAPVSALPSPIPLPFSKPERKPQHPWPASPLLYRTFLHTCAHSVDDFLGRTRDVNSREARKRALSQWIDGSLEALGQWARCGLLSGRQGAWRLGKGPW